jgi:hypothetical protein
MKGNYPGYKKPYIEEWGLLFPCPCPFVLENSDSGQNWQKYGRMVP